MYEKSDRYADFKCQHLDWRDHNTRETMNK